ncbi:two-component regulator propeller domain-containing protein [uncultured Paludibaculum sp.]|uniref:two-component regulator propeller domain-containing protein n=1 Tax=uncultured Paludibaculum sp. TaxID=1765020 RepID=UPI002AAA9DC9|nr:two-component regulator propeller domain-containing protein [uncultured Paludibaculum sp.]
MVATNITLVVLCLVPTLFGLNPQRRMSQYAHRQWTQAEGLPQDTVRALAQSRDGYLWIGTEEGLARFDGMEFTIFTRDADQLPNNLVTSLWAARDGSVWIGTAGGLARYHAGRFTIFSAKDGVPSAFITSIHEDSRGTVWVAAGLSLCRYRDGRFTAFGQENGIPAQGVRAAIVDGADRVWVSTFGSIGVFENDRYQPLPDDAPQASGIALCMALDAAGHVVAGGTNGVVLEEGGRRRLLTVADGLPAAFVRAVAHDRDGVLWIGTNSGLCRRVGNRIESVNEPAFPLGEWVWCLFQDREGNLWVGTNSGLHLFRDQNFAVFGKNEGLPSDQPTTVMQARDGAVWVGFHDGGVGRFVESRFVTVQGLPSKEVFCLREASGGEVLVGTRAGLTRIRGGSVTTYVPNDPVGRHNVFDAMEVAPGKLWLATNRGVLELAEGKESNPIAGGPLLNDAVVALLAARDGSRWAGTFGSGLWHWRNGQLELITVDQGLSSNQIRSLAEDDDGTIWIGTAGGGLAFFREGRFWRCTAANGLPSDNVAHITDDGMGWLWLATTRGLARIEKTKIKGLVRNPAERLPVVVFGIGEGLKSMNCAPGWPASTGGGRSRDGRLWFPTVAGLAAVRPERLVPDSTPLPAHVVEVRVDGADLVPTAFASLPPNSHRIEFRYGAVRLAAPESVRYRYKLEGLDAQWIEAGTRRVANYNTLPSGHYRFVVSASDSRGAVFGEMGSFSFERTPHLYERWWFRWLVAAGVLLLLWLISRWRILQERHRFSLVLAERARLAREIHDTLAQGYVGISSQLEAVSMLLPKDPAQAGKYLSLAQKMAHHSLTEARRSVMDLRDRALEGQTLAQAMEQTSRMMTAGRGLTATVHAAENLPPVPKETEQQLLRIAQEALANALKHAAAKHARIQLQRQGNALKLSITDDGGGFDANNAFLAAGGHFGLLGMQERAQRAGGSLKLETAPGAGTTIEVTVPLS